MCFKVHSGRDIDNTYTEINYENKKILFNLLTRLISLEIYWVNAYNL